MEVAREELYPTDEDDKGVNYSDTFSIPEEPKRVVTASRQGDRDRYGSASEETGKKKAEKAEKEQAGELQCEPGDQTEGGSGEEGVRLPPVTLLKKGKSSARSLIKEYRETAIKLQQTLQNFGVGVTVTNISCGPLGHTV